MPRSLFAIALLAVALAVSACAASVAPGWTYAPPTVAPSAEPAASGSASAGPGAGATAVPPGAASASPSGDPGAAPSGSVAAGTLVQVSASGMNFEQAEISAPANTPFVIHFNNKDAGTPHDIEIRDSMGMSKFKGDLITGPAEVDYQVPALPPGTYTFNCTVHLNMTGTLKVGA